MVSKELQDCFDRVIRDAQQSRHAIITVEHILLGLLDCESVSIALRICAVDIEDMHESLSDYIFAKRTLMSDDGTEPVIAPELKHVWVRAVSYRLSRPGSGTEVTGTDVVLAILHDTSLICSQTLLRARATKLAIMTYVGTTIEIPISWESPSFGCK